MRNSTGAVRRAKPLRHGALATELTCRPVDARTVVLEILIEYDAQMRTLEQLGEHALRFSIGWRRKSLPSSSSRSNAQSTAEANAPWRRIKSKTASPSPSQTIASPSIKPDRTLEAACSGLMQTAEHAAPELRQYRNVYDGNGEY